MKNAEFNLAAFLNCCLVEKNNLFTETLLKKAFMTFESKNNTFSLSNQVKDFTFSLCFQIKNVKNSYSKLVPGLS